MNNRNAILFVIATLTIFAVVYVIRIFGKEDSWYEIYKESPKDPYTVYLLDKVLQDYYPEQTFTKLTKKGATDLPHDAQGNYFFVGAQYYTNETAIDSLLQFVERGNTAFIASKEIPYRLVFRLFKGDKFCNKEDYDKDDTKMKPTARFNFLHPQIQLDSGFVATRMGKEEEAPHLWHYISHQYLCKKGYQPIGTMDDNFVNFAFLPYGKGKVYFHTNPILFTNYFLMQNTGKTYFDGVMAHLPKGDIYYDIAARSRPINQGPDQSPRHRRSSPRFQQDGPLTYILKQPPLAYAWYMLLSIGVLFLLFRSKRKQRIIPIVEKNENTSLVFIQNISDLYFQQGNNKLMCKQKFTHFLDFVWSKYGIRNRNNEQEFIQKLAQKSGIEESLIKKIMVLNQNINASTFLSDDTLTKFVTSINHFYHNCK